MIVLTELDLASVDPMQLIPMSIFLPPNISAKYFDISGEKELFITAVMAIVT